MKLFVYNEIEELASLLARYQNDKQHMILSVSEGITESTNGLWLVSQSSLQRWRDKFSAQYYILVGNSTSVFEKNCLGYISSNMLESLSEQELDTIINSYYEVFEKRLLEDELEDTVKELENLREQVIHEIGLAKQIYKQMVPLRSDRFAELQISSKFSSGLQGGGEYFEWKRDKHGLSFYIFTTSSYAFTAKLSNIFSEQVSFASQEIQRELFDRLMGEYVAFQERKNVDSSFLYYYLDFSSMELRGVSWGGQQLIAGSGDFVIAKTKFLQFAENVFSYKVHRGEKLLLISQGFRDSLKKLGLSTEVSIDSMNEYSARHFFDVEFMRLFDKCEDDFLPFDSTLILIEVLKNGICKV